MNYIKLLKDNLDITALAISSFSAIMLIWSNYESVKSRQLQYLPFLRMTIESSDLLLKEQYFECEHKPFDINTILEQYFKNYDEWNNHVCLHNDGVGIAKNIRVLFDFKSMIKFLEGLPKDTKDLFYLKPYFDIYEIKSFISPLCADFKMSLSYKTEIYNKFIKLFADLKFRILKKEQEVHLKMKKSLIYRTYSLDIIHPNSRESINMYDLFQLISLITLVETAKNRVRFKIPMYIDYYNLETRKKIEYYDLIWDIDLYRYDLQLSNQNYYDIVNGNIEIKDVCENFVHTAKNNFLLRKRNRVNGFFKFLIFRLRGII